MLIALVVFITHFSSHEASGSSHPSVRMAGIRDGEQEEQAGWCHSLLNARLLTITWLKETCFPNRCLLGCLGPSVSDSLALLGNGHKSLQLALLLLVTVAFQVVTLLQHSPVGFRSGSRIVLDLLRRSNAHACVVTLPPFALLPALFTSAASRVLAILFPILLAVARVTLFNAPMSW